MGDADVEHPVDGVEGVVVRGFGPGDPFFAECFGEFIFFVGEPDLLALKEGGHPDLETLAFGLAAGVDSPDRQAGGAEH